MPRENVHVDTHCGSVLCKCAHVSTSPLPEHALGRTLDPRSVMTSRREARCCSVALRCCRVPLTHGAEYVSPGSTPLELAVDLFIELQQHGVQYHHQVGLEFQHGDQYHHQMAQLDIAENNFPAERNVPVVGLGHRVTGERNDGHTLLGCDITIHVPRLLSRSKGGASSLIMRVRADLSLTSSWEIVCLPARVWRPRPTPGLTPGSTPGSTFALNPGPTPGPDPWTHPSIHFWTHPWT